MRGLSWALCLTRRYPRRDGRPRSENHRPLIAPHPEVRPTMPTHTPPPAPGTSRDTKGARVPLRDIPLRDAEGSDIPLQSRVEQITVDKTHGALPCRLHQQGQVIGRDAHLLYVRFECDYQMIDLRPPLVRVLETPEGC
jgi:hypothetical protein